MNNDFAEAMRRAALSPGFAEAARVIRDALGRRTLAGGRAPPAGPEIAPPPQPSAPFPADADAEIVEPSAQSPRMRRSMGEALRILREGRRAAGAFGAPDIRLPGAGLPGLGLPGSGLPGMVKPAPEIAIPDGAQFLARSFTGKAGTRRYRLYIPASAPDRPQGLVVMLHGCRQNPEDFAAGTGMNAVAEANGLLVAYPGQAGTDNASSCWNWFRPSDQRRDAGEPAIIAGITEEILTEFALDRRRVFVAGLSAGGAMAAVMAETYPDLYAAAGIHSGLACGSANDAMSAFAVMRGDAGVPTGARPRAAAGRPAIRTIVFQGGADRTVHPSNAERIVAQASPPGARHTARGASAHAAGGRTYTRTIVADAGGKPVVEYWLVDGAGHAWSGGRAEGSYTDPQGPDASREMVRFFLDQR